MSGAPRRIRKRGVQPDQEFTKAARERAEKRRKYLRTMEAQYTGRHRHRVDEALSALVFCIKDGNAGAARYWAAELDLSGLDDRVWDALITHSSQTVGLAFPNAIVDVVRFHGFWQEAGDATSVEARAILHTVVRYLCLLPKSMMVAHCTTSAVITGGAELQVHDWGVRLGIKKRLRMCVSSLQDSQTAAVAQAITCVTRGIIERDELRAVRTATQLVMWDKADAVWDVLWSLSTAYPLYEWARMYVRSHRGGYEIVTSRANKARGLCIEHGHPIVMQAILLMVRPAPQLTSDFHPSNVICDQMTTVEYYSERALPMAVPKECIDVTTVRGLERGATFQRWYEDTHRLQRVNETIADPYETSAFEALEYANRQADSETGIARLQISQVVEDFDALEYYQQAMYQPNPWADAPAVLLSDEEESEPVVECPEIPEQPVHFSERMSTTTGLGLGTMLEDMRPAVESSDDEPGDTSPYSSLPAQDSDEGPEGPLTVPLDKQAVPPFERVEFTNRKWACVSIEFGPEDVVAFSECILAFMQAQPSRIALDNTMMPVYEVGLEHIDSDLQLGVPGSCRFRVQRIQKWDNARRPPCLVGFAGLDSLKAHVETCRLRRVSYLLELIYRYVGDVGARGDPWGAFLYDLTGECWMPSLCAFKLQEEVDKLALPNTDKGKFAWDQALAAVLCVGFEDANRTFRGLVESLLLFEDQMRALLLTELESWSVDNTGRLQLVRYLLA